MLLHEANNYLKKEITGGELDKVHPLYCLLDLTKEEFYKIVDAVGIEVLASGHETYKRLQKANILLQEKERYEKRKKEILELDAQIAEFELRRKETMESILHYEEQQKQECWTEE